MGLWVRNVGLRTAAIPQSLAALAAGESVWVPQTRCWTWTTLGSKNAGSDDLDEERLDEIARCVAAEAGAPALAFLVDDSDVAYLVGADAGGIGSRLAIGVPEPAPHEFERAAAWAAEHAPAAPTAEALREAAGRPYLLAEKGLWVVLAAMGLVPAEEAAGAELVEGADVADDWTDEDERREREDMARIAVPEEWGEPVENAEGSRSRGGGGTHASSSRRATPSAGRWSRMRSNATSSRSSGFCLRSSTRKRCAKPCLKMCGSGWRTSRQPLPPGCASAVGSWTSSGSPGR